MKTQIKLVHSLIADPLILSEIHTSEDTKHYALGEMKKEAQDYLVDPTWVPDSTIFGGHYKDASGNCVVME